MQTGKAQGGLEFGGGWGGFCEMVLFLCHLEAGLNT